MDGGEELDAGVAPKKPLNKTWAAAWWSLGGGKA